MSFYDDYVADGLCCQSCGTFIGNEPGYPQFCFGCDPERQKAANAKKAKRERRKSS